MHNPTIRAETFARDGYLVVPSFASPNEVQDALSEMQTAVTAVQPIGNTPEREFFGVYSLRTEPRLDLDRPGIRRLAQKPALHALAQEIIGEDAELVMTLSQVYEPHQGHRQAWHTDTDPLDLPACFVTMLVYLQDQTDEQGLTRVVPGSQTTPMTKRFDPHADLPGQAAVKANAGTLCAFQSTTWHSATENHSDQPRYLLGFRFSRPAIAADDQWLRRARHAQGYRRFGRPIQTQPNDLDSYPWPDAYRPAELPWLG